MLSDQIAQYDRDNDVIFKEEHKYRDNLKNNIHP